MNIAIRTTDNKDILFYDTTKERVVEICKKANIRYEDLYEIKNEDLQYYCFENRVWETK